jgi:hypothetical protein
MCHVVEPTDGWLCPHQDFFSTNDCPVTLAKQKALSKGARAELAEARARTSTTAAGNWVPKT